MSDKAKFDESKTIRKEIKELIKNFNKKIRATTKYIRLLAYLTKLTSKKYPKSN